MTKRVNEKQAQKPVKLFDIYQASANNRLRYLLGKKGQRNLIVVGSNPNKADEYNSDITITKSRRVAERYGFDGFVMVNLYPLRTRTPGDLPQRVNNTYLHDNIAAIADSASSDVAPVVWAAWGRDIEQRHYLIRSLELMEQALAEQGAQWLQFGEPLKQGHPRHPSRLSYSWEFSPFDCTTYVQSLTQK